MRIVTAYYKIPNKIHTLYNQENAHDYYLSYINLLLKHVKRPILFFTDKECHADLMPLAGDNVEFILQPFNELKILDEFPQKFWEDELKKDSMKFHTWQLGAIWANKVKFIEQAAQQYPDEEWWVWMDAGCIRTNDWIPYLEDFTYRPFIQLKPGVYLQGSGESLEITELVKYKNINIQAAIILVHKDYAELFNKSYNQLLHVYHNSPLACISDQIIMSTLSHNNKEWIYRIINKQKALPDTSFFFLAYL